MDVVAAVLVTLIGSAGVAGAASGMAQLSRPARLRSAIGRDLELAEKLPQGSAARAALVVTAQSAAVDLAVIALERRRHAPLSAALFVVGLGTFGLSAWALRLYEPLTRPPEEAGVVLYALAYVLLIAASLLARPDRRRRRDRRRAILNRDPAAWVLPRTGPYPSVAEDLLPSPLMRMWRHLTGPGSTRAE